MRGIKLSGRNRIGILLLIAVVLIAADFVHWMFTPRAVVRTPAEVYRVEWVQNGEAMSMTEAVDCIRVAQLLSESTCTRTLQPVNGYQQQEGAVEIAFQNEEWNPGHIVLLPEPDTMSPQFFLYSSAGGACYTIGNGEELLAQMTALLSGKEN